MQVTLLGYNGHGSVEDAHSITAANFFLDHLEYLVQGAKLDIFGSNILDIFICDLYQCPTANDIFDHFIMKNTKFNT